MVIPKSKDPPSIAGSGGAMRVLLSPVYDFEFSVALAVEENVETSGSFFTNGACIAAIPLPKPAKCGGAAIAHLGGLEKYSDTAAGT